VLTQQQQQKQKHCSLVGLHTASLWVLRNALLLTHPLPDSTALASTVSKVPPVALCTYQWV
jgi:hypothetical protein